MKCRNLLPLLLVVISTVCANADEHTPIGKNRWLRTDGSVRAVMAPGDISLTYQKADSSWDDVVNDWVQIGTKKRWKSIRGHHRVFADSTGAAIYSKGGHFLGTKTTQLIKFNKLDSTSVFLKSSLPDSVTFSDNAITFHGIFPGVDKQLVNDPFFFEEYRETFIFHQEARDSLATWGPWVNRLLGTVTRLDTDSLNLSLRDASGLFNITSTGRETDGWVGFEDGGNRIFSVAQSSLNTSDSTTSIPVRKRIVLVGGTPYLVELFDPIAADALPAVDIWHNATFGVTIATDLGTVLEDRQFGGVATSGVAGTLDSITMSTDCGSTNHDTRFAVFLWTGAGGTGDDFVDSIAAFTATDDSGTPSWKSHAVINNASILASTDYILVGWTEAAASTHQARFTNNALYTGSYDQSRSYDAIWQDPFDHSASEDGEWRVSIYGTYTESAVSSRRRI